MADQQEDREKDNSSEGVQRKRIRIDSAHTRVPRPWFLIRGKDRPDER